MKITDEQNLFRSLKSNESMIVFVESMIVDLKMLLYKDDDLVVVDEQDKDDDDRNYYNQLIEVE